MNSRASLWAGFVLSVLPSLLLLFSGVMKLMGGPQLAEGFQMLGWPIHLAVPLGILEIAVTLIYLYPRTAVLGAILVTGYLGGAVATHVRIGDAFWMPVLLGVLVWGGLFLRDLRLRALLPINR